MLHLTGWNLIPHFLYDFSNKSAAASLIRLGKGTNGHTDQIDTIFILLLLLFLCFVCACFLCCCFPFDFGGVFCIILLFFSSS